MDALATAAASSDEAAPPSSPNKSPTGSDSDSEDSAVPEVPAEETKPTPPTPTLKSLVEEDDDRKCSYRDFSHVAPKAEKPSTRHKEPTFPMKLHMILSNPEFQHIIAWLPHGRSWRILQQKDFEQRVIPLFFRHGRYSSFARQVNGWGFMRITHGSDFGSYYHERFLRGMPHLCEKMRRLTGKDAGSRKKAEAERTPDLHAMSRTNPLPEGPIVKEYPSVSEASFMAHRRAQVLQQMDLIAASNRMGQPMVPSMGGMAGMGYPNGQDPLLMMQYGGAPMNAHMQNQLLMRQLLASQNVGGGAPNFGANMGGNGLGAGAPNFGVNMGGHAIGAGAPNLGANMGGNALGAGAPNFGAPNGLSMGGTAGMDGAAASVAMGGQLDMSQLLAMQNAQSNSAQCNLAHMTWNQQQQKHDEFDQFRGGAMPNGK